MKKKHDEPLGSIQKSPRREQRKLLKLYKRRAKFLSRLFCSASAKNKSRFEGEVSILEFEGKHFSKKFH